jgi:hypothetical protein
VLRFLDAGARVVFGDLNEATSEALVAVALFLAGPDSEFVTARRYERTAECWPGGRGWRVPTTSAG